jgi:hypothetical protein
MLFILFIMFSNTFNMSSIRAGSSQDKIINWLKRLEIAEDAAKGVYLMNFKIHFKKKSIFACLIFPFFGK